MVIHGRRFGILGGILALLAALEPGVPARAQQPDKLALVPQPPVAEADQPEPGIVVQARGPVHEAFAQPTDVNPQPGPVVPRQPPPPIPEEPPEQKPDGDNVQWIPGYWGWDVDRNDFVWVSGFWRVPPPGRRWVPGYWSEAEGGWQWVSGFWAPAAENNLPYLPSPPASLEVGPSVPAPDENSFYVPGNWIDRDDRYAWQPGFWQAARPGWIWAPAHYCWTPGGNVFVNGYWDRCLEDRGLLFAPVSFDRPLWTAPDWYYRPRFTVNSGGLLASLFARPYDGYYYFGDYYDARYARLGFQPWYQYGSRFHDPLFAYDRWAHRGEPGWYGGLRDSYLARRDGRLTRPPRTWGDQTVLLRQNHLAHNNTNALNMVGPLSQVRRDRGRLVALNASQLAGQRSAIARIRQTGLDRRQVERFGRPGAVDGSRRSGAAPGGRLPASPNVAALRSGGGPAGIRASAEGKAGGRWTARALSPESRRPEAKPFTGPAHAFRAPEHRAAPHVAVPAPHHAAGTSSHHAPAAPQRHPSGPQHHASAPAPQHHTVQPKQQAHSFTPRSRPAAPQSHAAPARHAAPHAAPANHQASHSGSKHHR